MARFTWQEYLAHHSWKDIRLWWISHQQKLFSVRRNATNLQRKSPPKYLVRGQLGILHFAYCPLSAMLESHKKEKLSNRTAPFDSHLLKTYDFLMYLETNALSLITHWRVNYMYIALFRMLENLISTSFTKIYIPKLYLTSLACRKITTTAATLKCTCGWMFS